MNLRKKIGPLPLWLWLLAGVIAGWYLYRRMKGTSGSSGQAIETQQVLPQVSSQPAAALGASTSAGSPADTGQSTSDFLAALGAENANLISALTARDSNIAGLAASQIATAQTATNLGSFNQNTQPVAGVEPNSNSPQVIYVMPQVTSNPNASPPAQTVAPSSLGVSSTIKSAVSRYYTYKRDVPLGPGQTVHFTSGRGYYAA